MPWGAKLQISWMGPRRIAEALSDWVFRVEDLRSGDMSVHHASRLKLFGAADMNVTQSLLDHVAYVEGGHLVEALQACRFDKSAKEWVLKVKWMGLDDLESTWEPAVGLYEDVPTIVRAAIRKNSALPEWKEMAAALHDVMTP